MDETGESKKLTIIIIILALLILFISNIGCFYTPETIKYEYLVKINVGTSNEYEILIPALLDDDKELLKLNKNLFDDDIKEKSLNNTKKGWAIEIRADESLNLKYKKDFNFNSEDHFYMMSLENSNIEKEKLRTGGIKVSYWILFNSTNNENASISIFFKAVVPNHGQEISIFGNLTNGWNLIYGARKEWSD